MRRLVVPTTMSSGMYVFSSADLSQLSLSNGSNVCQEVRPSVRPSTCAARFVTTRAMKLNFGPQVALGQLY